MRLLRTAWELLSWQILTVLTAVFFSILLVASPPAHAEGTVFVDPSYPNAAQVEYELKTRLIQGDEISVYVWSVATHLHPTIEQPSQIVIIVDDATVAVNGVGDWPDDVWLQEKLTRAEVVARDPLDRTKLMIRDIHAWQLAHPKPVPPAPPEEPLNLMPWIIWSGGILVAFVALRTIIGMVKRRSARRAELLARFESSDPNDLYGQYKPVDLGE